MGEVQGLKGLESTLQRNVERGTLELNAKIGRPFADRCFGCRVILASGTAVPAGIGPPVCSSVALPETFGATEVSIPVMVTAPGVVEAVIVAL